MSIFTAMTEAQTREQFITRQASQNRSDLWEKLERGDQEAFEFVEDAIGFELATTEAWKALIVAEAQGKPAFRNLMQKVLARKAESMAVAQADEAERTRANRD